MKCKWSDVSLLLVLINDSVVELRGRQGKNNATLPLKSLVSIFNKEDGSQFFQRWTEIKISTFRNKIVNMNAVVEFRKNFKRNFFRHFLFELYRALSITTW